MGSRGLRSPWPGCCVTERPSLQSIQQLTRQEHSAGDLLALPQPSANLVGAQVDDVHKLGVNNAR